MTEELNPFAIAQKQLDLFLIVLWPAIAILVIVVPVGVFLVSLEWDGDVPAALGEI